MGRATDGDNIIPFRRRAPDPIWLTAYVRFWTESLDQLVAYVAQLQTQETSPMSDLTFDYPTAEPVIICTRSFDAPLALVWRVFTEPQHVLRWWGPKSLAPISRIEALDLRKGGKWRFVCARPDGSQQIVFQGVYVDVVPFVRVANSFGVEGAFEGDEDFPEIHTFEERAGRTFYKSTTLLPDFAARDAIVATGMEKGGRESMEQLGQLVDELARETA